MSARPASAASPMTTTLATVPRPGHWRSGTQSSSTSAPTTIVTWPKVSGTCVAMPAWKTSHGSRPSVERIIIAIETP